MKSLLMLTGLGVLSLVAELVNLKRLLFALVLAGLLVTVGVSLKDWDTNIHLYNNMLVIDNFAISLTCLLCGITILWLLMFDGYIQTETSVSDVYALILFALTGAFVMAAYNNICMLFLGIEIMSLSVYVLAGSRKNDLASNESALKYFLMGSFATGFFLFGVALIYGVTGSFHIEVIGNYVKDNAGSLPGIFTAGMLLMAVGMAFKISAAPFHYWAPDVYTGAPTPVTTFMATIVKTAAIAAFIKLFYVAFGYAVSGWVQIISLMAVLTMFVGNITAIFQTSVKRMLAYSGIAHAGYLLVGLLALNDQAVFSVFYYLLTYSLASILAFSILFILSGHQHNAGVEIFNGLVKRNKLMAFGMAVAMLSLAGIPPLAGFFGKYFIFNAAIDAGRYKLVLLAVVASLISLYYYFKPLIAIFNHKPDHHSGEIMISPLQKLVIVICMVLLVLLSAFPDLLIKGFR